MTLVYGVDTEKAVTPKDVRDAVIKCFTEAHTDALEDFNTDNPSLTSEEISSLKLTSVKELVKQYFDECNGDFDNPTKDSLFAVLEKLKVFAANFRNQETIEKHYAEILILMDILP